TLIDELLAEQGNLTAVERFAEKHERNALPTQARYYRDLIPLQRPQPGEQYAFAVDLDACTGCKACVSACHSLNGLDDGEVWRTVGLIHSDAPDEPFQQTVTSACHHCEDPACANGCPVLAYEKDADTGIVRHLDDQCIGCQYCVLKCPYDVPKYSKKRGIVRKCDMCQSRLAVGEAPACVQACPNEAIRIEVVGKGGSTLQSGSRLVPGAFDSSYTRPTTNYRTSRPRPLSAHAADGKSLRLEDPHIPLVAMLVLTQMAVGLHAALFFAGENVHAVAIAAFVVLQFGLAVSVMHLGKPLKAWRAFLGLRKSWMSREIVVFGMYAGAAFGMVVLGWRLLAFASLASGLLGVFCSAMIYVDTRRPFWGAWLTMPKFFGTTMVLGATACGALLACLHSPVASGFVIGATVIRTVLFAWETAAHFSALHNEHSATHRSALTTGRLMRWLPITRAALFAIATIASVAAVLTAPGLPPLWAALAFLCTLCSQLLERYNYFRAVVAPRMPGNAV
ncbi:MAG: DmsC/YnfH family molybdoenzyme membrane anchor subunit, partial [Chthoniobacteraceae bacterium]